VLTLIQEVLTEASSGSLGSLTKIIAQVEAYINGLPSSLQTCLQSSGPEQEGNAIQTALHIAGMPTSEIIAKVTSYITLHLSTIVADVKTMNTAFGAGQFQAVGTDACQVAQAIFGSTWLVGRSYISDASANVCDIATGIYTQAGLPAPTAMCSCADETTAANLLTLIGEVLQEASSGSLSVITKIEQQVEAFIATVP